MAQEKSPISSNFNCPFCRKIFVLLQTSNWKKNQSSQWVSGSIRSRNWEKLSLSKEVLWWISSILDWEVKAAEKSRPKKAGGIFSRGRFFVLKCLQINQVIIVGSEEKKPSFKLNEEKHSFPRVFNDSAGLLMQIKYISVPIYLYHGCLPDFHSSLSYYLSLFFSQHKIFDSRLS